MDSNLYISAFQRQPCLLKTNSTRVLVTWLVTLLLIICPSSYKARLHNLIGTANICPQIISPQWSNARPNFPTKKCVGGAKFGLVSRLVFPTMESYDLCIDWGSAEFVPFDWKSYESTTSHLSEVYLVLHYNVQK